MCIYVCIYVCVYYSSTHSGTYTMYTKQVDAGYSLYQFPCYILTQGLFTEPRLCYFC